jgi:cytochrome oxidase Cu insertion factor (SCO1/SenC/PrrC family)
MCSLGRVAGGRSCRSLFFGLVVAGFLCLPPAVFAIDGESSQKYPKLPFSTDFGGPFELIDHNGHKVSEQDFLGRYVILYFGYTNCADICPTALYAIGQTLIKLGGDAEKITPLFVNLDLERDSLVQLEQYVHFFHPSFIGMTGSERALARAAGAYGIRYRYARNEDGSTLMVHSGKIFLLAPSGEVLEYFPHEVSVDWLLTGIARNLSQTVVSPP